MFKLYKGFFEMNVSAAVLTDGRTVINSNSDKRGKGNNSWGANQTPPGMFFWFCLAFKPAAACNGHSHTISKKHSHFIQTQTHLHWNPDLYPLASLKKYSEVHIKEVKQRQTLLTKQPGVHVPLNQDQREHNVTVGVSVT